MPKIFIPGAITVLALCTVAQSPNMAMDDVEVRVTSRAYQPVYQFHAEAKLVDVDVVVRDGRGHTIDGLMQNDFEIYDDGKLRTMTGFSISYSTEQADTGTISSSTPSSDDPIPGTIPKPVAVPSRFTGRSIVLFFDDVNTTPRDLGPAKKAAVGFIHDLLATGDRMAIITTSADMVLDFTGDQVSVIAAIEKLEPHPRVNSGGMTASCPRITPYQGYQIVSGDLMALSAAIAESCTCPGNPASIDPPSCLADADIRNVSKMQNRNSDVFAQAQQTWDQARDVSQMTLAAIRSGLDHLSNAPGKRMLLLASSGFLSATLEKDVDAIINDAIHSQVVINSLETKGLYAEFASRPFDQPSQGTGGLPNQSALFDLGSLSGRLDSEDAAMAKFAESTGGLLFHNNNDISLGFKELGLVPHVTYLLSFPPADDGKYHKLKVKLKKRHDTLQARPGYFAPGNGSVPQPDSGNVIDREVMAQDSRSAIPVDVKLDFAKSSEALKPFTVALRMNIVGLPFKIQDDRRLEKLVLITALFDGQSNFVVGKQAVMDLNLKPDTFERLSHSGMNGVMTLFVPSGTYRMRVVIAEQTNGAMTVLNQPIQVP